MNYKNIIIFLTIILYSCSPINKQHGYLLDDMLSSSDSMANFTINETKKSDIYATMGSPSVEIKDINKIWIYLISLKENNLLNEDYITFQTILRFEFDNSDNLVKKDIISADSYTDISFSNEKTKVERNAYGITDQLYDAFTRGR
tara:strand:+ start:122 stop:556 length:435 start_codon:yes stop_codon:yes gene_type:complete